MDWPKIWRTVFAGWDGDVDFAALARELAGGEDGRALPGRDGGTGFGDEDEAAAWVRQQIQEAY